MLLVVAAGNDGKDIDKHPVYPASFENGNILTVAASTSTDTLASFSNYGSTNVDVAAPGDIAVPKGVDEPAGLVGTRLQHPATRWRRPPPA